MGTPERLELELSDGTPVVARPLVPGDRAGLAEAYRRLSPEARFNRFWTHGGDEIGPAMLDRVLAQDPASHLSWTVLDPAREFSPLAGASWWRQAARPDEAELSLIVLDADQGRGIGTLLLALMWLTALHAGASSLVGYVHPGNRQAAGWMRACGAVGGWDGYKLVFRWENLHDLRGPADFRAGRELAAWLARLAPRLLP